jgi:transmembrane sensor
MPDDLDWQLLERYIAGDCTAEEAAIVRRWLETDPHAREYVAALGRAMELDQRTPDDWDTDPAWTRLAETTGISPRPRAEPPLRLVTAKPVRRLAARWGWIAAAAAVVLSVAGIGLLDRQAGRGRPVAVSTLRELTSPRGQRLETRLADGTRVILAPASRLGVPGDYGKGSRTVHLDGEAYFEVVHDPATPFAVRARYAVARDLGTRFVVRAREGEPDVRVVVAQGKVALGRDGVADSGAALLGTGDLGRLDTAGMSSVVSGVSVDRYLGWTRGRLVFDQTPLDQVGAEIGRWYDVQVTLAVPALANQQLTIAFENEPLDHVLDAVAFALHLRYERSGKQVTFYSARSSP